MLDHRCRNLGTFLALVGAAVGQRPTGRLEGTVVDVLGERLPLADITVLAGSEVVRRLRCDALGCFALAKVPLGTVTVVARAPGRLASCSRVELDAQQAEACVHLRLLDAGCVTGQVLAADGKAVAGALVALLSVPRCDAVTEDHAFTDATGCYRLTSVPVGEARLVVMADGHDARYELLPVTGETRCDVQLAVGATAVYQLMVGGASAEQWSGMTCRFGSARGPAGLPQDLGSVWPHRREGNTLVFAGLPANLLIHDVTIETGLTELLRWNVDPTGGVHCREGELQGPEPPTEVLRGTLRNPNGQPLAGHRIARLVGPADQATVTDARGHFELPVLAGSRRSHALWLDEEEYVLHGAGSGRDRATVYVADGSEVEHDLVADRAASVSGRLLDADGFPVFGADVQLIGDPREKERTYSGRWPEVQVACGRTARNGSFRLGRLDGHLGFNLWVRLAAAEGLLVGGPVQLAPGRNADFGILCLPRPAVIEGSITNAGGPCAGRKMWLVRVPALPHTEEYCTGCTDRFGRFRFTGLPAGSYSVKTAEWQLSSASKWTDPVMATVQPGERAVVLR